jgi:hypothetical protein
MIILCQNGTNIICMDIFLHCNAWYWLHYDVIASITSLIHYNTLKLVPKINLHFFTLNDLSLYTYFYTHHYTLTSISLCIYAYIPMTISLCIYPYTYILMHICLYSYDYILIHTVQCKKSCCCTYAFSWAISVKHMNGFFWNFHRQPRRCYRLQLERESSKSVVL